MPSVAKSDTVYLLVPQLTRFSLLSFHGDHTPVEGRRSLESEVDEQFSVRLEQKAEEKDGAVTKKWRVSVQVRFQGHWRSDGIEKPVIQVDAVYNGRFDYKPDADPAAINKLLGDTSYRYGLLSQVYPLAQQHLVEQLRLMNLTIRRRDGLDPAIMAAEVEVVKQNGLPPTKTDAQTRGGTPPKGRGKRKSSD